MDERYARTFMTIVHALANDSLVVMECVDKRTGQPTVCLCAAVSRRAVEDGATPADLRFMPLARLFDGDPNDEVVVPKGVAQDGSDIAGDANKHGGN